MSDLDKISSVFNAKIDSVKTKDDLQNIKTEFFGKNGQITLQFKSLGSLDPEKRKEFASNLNKIKDDLTHQLEQKNIEIETSEINEKLKNDKVAKIKMRIGTLESILPIVLLVVLTIFPQYNSTFTILIICIVAISLIESVVFAPLTYIAKLYSVVAHLLLFIPIFYWSIFFYINKNSKNLKFGRGYNEGLKKINVEDNDFIILLNDDTIVSRNFIDELINPLVKDQKAIISTPKILYSSNINKIWYAGGVVDLWRGLIYHIGIRDFDGPKYSFINETDYATGCCMCLRFEDLKKLNYRKKVAFLFGSEASGLSNNEISYANYTLQIPTNPDFKSLNLSHSLIIIAQYLSSIINSKTSSFKKSSKVKSASKKEIVAMANLCIQNLEEINFFKSKEKKPIMLENLRNIFYRMELSTKETRILSGVFASLGKKRWLTKWWVSL